MLAKLFGFGSKQPPAAASSKEPEDAVLKARIRTFVKTNVATPPVRRHQEDSELAFIAQDVPVPMRVLADGDGGNDIPPPDRATGGDGRMPPLNEIYLTPEAMASDDLYMPIQMTIDIYNHLTQEAGHIAADLPEAARQAYAVDYYRAQVLNGGHSQFIGNSCHRSGTQDQCRAGLEAMDAKAYLALFEEMHRLMARDPKLAEAVQQGGGLGELDPAIEALDKKFFALNDEQPLHEIIGPWLKSRPGVVVLPEDEIEKILIARGEHPVVKTRLAEQAAAKIENEKNDPMIKLARKLCWSAGLEWQGWSAVLPTLLIEGKTYENVWCMDTDQGLCFMMEYDTKKAALFRLIMPVGRELTLDDLGAPPQYDRLIVVGTKGDLPWAAPG